MEQRQSHPSSVVRRPSSVLRVALFEPDIPQNTGTILRLAACLGVGVDLVEPLGFALTDAKFRRAGLDYWEHAAMTRHASFAAFERWRRTAGRRLVLFTTRATLSYVALAYREHDVLLFGRESAGVDDAVRAAADAAVGIPIAPARRSLNVAIAAAMGLGEALRQTGGFPSIR